MHLFGRSLQQYDYMFSRQECVWQYTGRPQHSIVFVERNQGASQLRCDIRMVLFRGADFAKLAFLVGASWSAEFYHAR